MREDGWGSLPSGCHLPKEGGLPGGEFADAGLWVIFEIFKSSRRRRTSQRCPPPNRSHLPTWGGGGAGHRRPDPASSAFQAGVGEIPSSPRPMPAPGAWGGVPTQGPASCQPQVPIPPADAGGVWTGWGLLLYSSSFVSVSLTIWDTARGW